MSNIEKANHEFCKAVLKLESDARMVYLEMGERLHKIREEQLYAPYWDSWQEFCTEFKDISYSSISKMISVYEVFVLKYGYKKEFLVEVGGWTKLYALTNLVNSKAEAKIWLHNAKELNSIDLAREIKEVKTGIEMRYCAHKDSYTIKICRSCGERQKTE